MTYKESLAKYGDPFFCAHAPACYKDFCKDHNIKVSWSDKVYSGNGEESQRKCPAWGFSWKHGAVTFLSLRENTPENENRAYCAAAIEAFLWLSDIPSSLSCHLAEAYINFFKI